MSDRITRDTLPLRDCKPCNWVCALPIWSKSQSLSLSPREVGSIFYVCIYMDLCDPTNGLSYNVKPKGESVEHQRPHMNIIKLFRWIRSARWPCQEYDRESGRCPDTTQWACDSGPSLDKRRNSATRSASACESFMNLYQHYRLDLEVVGCFLVFHNHVKTCKDMTGCDRHSHRLSGLRGREFEGRYEATKLFKAEPFVKTCERSSSDFGVLKSGTCIILAWNSTVKSSTGWRLLQSAPHFSSECRY